MKLKKGGGSTWATSKVILVWLIDMLERTITLSEHRVACLHETLTAMHSSPETVHEVKVGFLTGVNVVNTNC